MPEELAAAISAERFKALWMRCLDSIPAMDASPVYKNLMNCYAEPHRRYHSCEHLAHCLHEFDRAAAMIKNRDAVEMALWFHDAVYVPAARDNEQRSADLFVDWSKGFLRPSLITKVCSLILITMHKQAPRNEEDCYAVDIDLSSFGIPWDDFVRDSRNVRAEQTGVGDVDFYPGQTQFLEALIKRPRIYHTKYFHSLYEESARQNIKRLLNLIATEGKA